MKKFTQRSFLSLTAAFLFFAIGSSAQNSKSVLTSPNGINFKVISLAKAKDSAKAESKPLFVFAHATWCPTCKQMENEVLINKALGDAYNQGLINVAIDLDSPEGKRFKELYPVRATPTLFFFNSDGSMTKKIEGFTPAIVMLAVADELKK